MVVSKIQGTRAIDDTCSSRISGNSCAFLHLHTRSIPRINQHVHSARFTKGFSGSLQRDHAVRQLGLKQHFQLAAASSASASPTPAPPPDLTSTFLQVVLPLSLALTLCNMDRICLSVAIMPIAAEFGWPASLQGVIQSAFLWGYMATQLLGGALADKHGGKVVIAAGLLWFSFAMALMPLCLTPSIVAAGLAVPVVLASRFMVGLGEGVVMPSMNALIAARLPPSARARGLGLAFTGFHTGNLLGLALSPMIVLMYGWRALFLLLGAACLPMLCLWLAAVPDVPAASTQAPQGSRPAAAPVSVGQILSSKATWAIIIVNVINHWGYFIYLNWLPSYFNQVLKLDLRSSSLFAFLPWLVMAFGSSAAGLLADALVTRGVPVVTVRKALQSIAFIIPAMALLALAQPSLSATSAVSLLCIALGASSLGQAGFVANMSDIAPRAAGKMFGICNTFGSAAGVLGVTAVGFVVEATGSFSPVFLLTSLMYVIGTVLWNLMCTADPIF